MQAAGPDKHGRGGGICAGKMVNDDCPLVSVGGHFGQVHCIDVSRDGKLLVTGGADCTVRVWERRGDTSIFTLKANGVLSVDSGVSSVAISTDGSKIAAANGYEIQLFDAQTQTKLGSTLTCDKQIIFLLSLKIVAAGDGGMLDNAGKARCNCGTWQQAPSLGRQ